LCENRYEYTSSKKNNERAKSEKMRDISGKYNNNNNNNIKNYDNNIIYNNDEYVNLANAKNSKLDKEIKNESDKSEINQLNNLFNSLKINKEAKINKIINLHTNNSNINNKFKIKKCHLNLDKFHISAKRRNFQKKINLSYINNTNQDLTNSKINNNFKNIYYIGNKTSIKHSNSDLISGEETKDSPENITDIEDDKFNLSIHKINHFFINLNESKEKKVDKSCSKLGNKNNLIFSHFDLDTD
jgi:hypothetical protein